jgi:glutamate synthase (NADPH/NADH) large chain
VRNSAAVAVVEGCGSNGCEYMTGGVAVILGSVGANFAAGMSGGMAFIYDVDEVLPERINPESVIHQRVETDYWEAQLRELISEHWRETQSAFAQQILVNWAHEKSRFWQVVPREMLERLEHPVTREAAAAAGE